MKNIRQYIKNILKEILLDEYFISNDIGHEDTEIIVFKYSYRTGTFQVISDQRYRNTPLKDIEIILRNKAREYNKLRPMIANDYPLEIRNEIRKSLAL